MHRIADRLGGGAGVERGAPWRPDHDESASLIFEAMPHDGQLQGSAIPTFTKCPGGVILRPGVARLRCGSGGDVGGTCHGACTVGGAQENFHFVYPGDGCEGSTWSRPAEFGVFLQHVTEYQQRQHRLFYNELIVESWAPLLPYAVEAFFEVVGAQQPGEEAARFHHTQFLKKFEVTAAEYPIVHMVKGDWTAPFRPFESQHLAFEQAHHPFNGG